MPKRVRLDDADYRALAEWRYALRRFLRASAEITRRGGVSATQYELLLFIRGASGGALTIAELAERLQVRHHSAVGLVDRCEKAKLVRRRRDPENRRRVLVQTTPRGAALLRRLAAAHFSTIEQLGRAFVPPIPGYAPRPPAQRSGGGRPPASGEPDELTSEG
jgi:DNA-binding MarR family transcriptional regulator